MIFIYIGSFAFVFALLGACGAIARSACLSFFVSIHSFEHWERFLMFTVSPWIIDAFKLYIVVHCDHPCIAASNGITGFWLSQTEWHGYLLEQQFQWYARESQSSQRNMGFYAKSSKWWIEFLIILFCFFFLVMNSH